MREQTRLKSGKWESGKALSGIRYFEGPIELMDEQDKKLWSVVRNEYSYSVISPEDIIPWLVGCDHVYTGSYAPFSPVTIEEEKPYLTIERKSVRRFPPQSQIDAGRRKQGECQHAGRNHKTPAGCLLGCSDQ